MELEQGKELKQQKEMQEIALPTIEIEDNKYYSNNFDYGLSKEGLDGQVSIRNIASNEAYGSSWSGVNNTPPSKNAIYDKIESITTDINNIYPNLFMLMGS